MKADWPTRWLLPATLLLVAGFLRLYRLDLASITADEGIHAMFAMNIAIFRDLPLVGLPSIGIRNSAFFLYLFAIPYAISRHPLAGAVFIVGLNLVALYVLYRFAERRFERGVAVVASVMVVFSPWMVVYARNMWPPSCVPVLSLAFIALTLKWLDDGDKRKLFGMTVLGFLLPQLHFSGFAASIWLAIALAVGRRQIRLAPLLLGVLFGVATLTPWLHYQHNINQWSDLQQVLAAAKGKHGLGETSAAMARYHAAILGSGSFDYWFNRTPEHTPEFFAPWHRSVRMVLETPIVVAFVLAVVWSFWQPRRDVRLLGVWCLLPVILLAIIRPDVHPHYVGAGFPIPFLLIAVFGKQVLQRLGRVRQAAKLAGAIWLTALCCSHSVFLYGWLGFVDAGKTDGAGHYQLSYRQRVEAAESILVDSPKRVVYLAGGFSGLAPAYQLPYSYLQMKRGFAKYPVETGLRYWVCDIHPPVEEPGWTTEREWKVGPTLIRRQRFDLRNLR